MAEHALEMELAKAAWEAERRWMRANVTTLGRDTLTWENMPPDFKDRYRSVAVAVAERLEREAAKPPMETGYLHAVTSVDGSDPAAAARLIGRMVERMADDAVVFLTGYAGRPSAAVTASSLRALLAAAARPAVGEATRRVLEAVASTDGPWVQLDRYGKECRFCQVQWPYHLKSSPEHQPDCPWSIALRECGVEVDRP